MMFGLEVLRSNPGLANDWGTCALLCNQASVTQDFESSWVVLQKILGSRLKAFFGPQHGFHATVQDNMIETQHSPKGPFGLPVYSLYSEVREPREEMLEGIDTIIADIQIVGCRVYTFKYTLAGCMRIAKRLGKRVVILDRPNPLGGIAVEGRVLLDKKASSFVGEYPIPLRHGLSLGEVGRLINQHVGCELELIKLQDWVPEKFWGHQLSSWVITSPNLPTIDSVYAYPATVMLEGTNLSEGRGTGLPFQFVGAPYIASAQEFVDRVRFYHDDPGVFLRASEFQPTSQKWAGKVCRGFQIHILHPERLRSYRLGLSIMKAAADLSNEFQWKGPPYEYDYINLPINLILGDLGAANRIETNFNLDDPFWSAGIDDYIERCEPILEYRRKLINIT